MFDKNLEITLKTIRDYAHKNNYEFLTVEQLLLGLLENEEAAESLRACGADLRTIYEDLETFIENNTPKDENEEPMQTIGFDRVLQRAMAHAQHANIEKLHGAHLLIALYSEQECYAIYVLKKQGVQRIDLINYVTHSMGETLIQRQEQAKNGNDVRLEDYALDLNKRAENGKIDPLIGRSQELMRMSQILCRRRKNNPLLVGESGVGKTALAEGLALNIVQGNVPEVLKDCTIYALDIGSLLAGTKYRGDFEKRLKSVLKALKKQENSIVFIDEIHTIIGAGSVQGGTLDVSNLIKPLLSNGELRCIGSTTYDEYRSVFEKDKALARRFQKIDVKEPSVEETIKILHGLKGNFEDFHGVTYTQDAIKACAELSARYVHERFLPDKAVDVLDEAGAATKVNKKATEANEKSEAVDAEERIEITEEMVEQIVAKMAQIPSATINQKDKEQLKHFKRNLKMTVFGQDDAIDALDDVIKLARAGLKDVDKPVGSFLFSGPTGVGKTEVCRQLSQQLNLELIRFDMSEYMERHTVSRLIGSPPGYVGYEEGGLLTEAVTKTPHCIVLFDEIEKAHPDVFNILLQVMDYGKLTDNNGRKADFRHAIIVMTTNAGADRIGRASMGFSEQDHTSDATEAIKKAFPPEFRNRLDAIIQFAPLSKDIVVNVVDKFINQLQQQLDEKKILLLVNDDVRYWIANKGYDKVMGARPMGRVIQEHLKKPLAEEVLFGELADNGGEVTVSVKDDALVLKIKAAQATVSLPVAETES